VKHNLEFKNCTPDRRVRQFVEASIARLDEVVNSRSSAVFLRVFVEKNAVRALYRVSLTLNVPGRTLAAQEERHDLLETLREAFMELERELRKHKEKLTHSDTYKRPARRPQLRRQKTEAVPHEQRRRELFFSLIEANLEARYNFTQREISYRHCRGRPSFGRNHRRRCRGCGRAARVS
jgi:ribosomal subunit interface protein